MENRLKKITVLFLLLIIYNLMCFFITPLFLDYLFTGNSVFKEMFAEIISLCLPIIIFLLCFKKNQKELLFEINDKKIASLERNEVFSWIIIIVLATMGLNYLFSLIDLIYITQTKDYSIINVIPKIEIITLLISIITTALIPAIFEEIEYRGMFYDCYKDSPAVAFFISNTVFSSMHGGIKPFFNALIIGVILFFCYKRTQSLKLVIIMHFICNLISFLTMNVFSLPLSPLSILCEYANMNQYIACMIFYIGMILLFISIIYFLLSINKSKDDNITKQKYSGIEIALSVFIVLFSIFSFYLRIFL